MKRKDEERMRARELRAQGWSLRRIALEVDVSLSSVSNWVRDVQNPVPPTPPPAPVPPADIDDGRRIVCGRCRESLPVTAFNRDGEGRQHWCRECYRIYFRERGELHRQQVKTARRRRRERAREFLRAYTSEHPCCDCGEDDPVILEFDHIGHKVEHVSQLVGVGATIERISEEVARCEVVCVNCHRRRTALRNVGGGRIRLNR